MSEQNFHNAESNETFVHRDRANGKRDLYIFKGDKADWSADHQHNVIRPGGSPSYLRDFEGRVIADDSKS